MSSGVMGRERGSSGESVLSDIVCDGRIKCCSCCSVCVTSVSVSGSNVVFSAGEIWKFCCQNSLWTASIPSAVSIFCLLVLYMYVIVCLFDPKSRLYFSQKTLGSFMLLHSSRVSVSQCWLLMYFVSLVSCL